MKALTLAFCANLFVFIHLLASFSLAYENFHASRRKQYIDDVIKMMTSYTGCVKLCNKRGACEAISYGRLHGTCTLHGQSDVESSLERRPGFAYSRKLDWKQPHDGVCTCQRGFECDDDRNCEPGDEPVKHGRLLGNMVALCNKVKLTCDPGYMPNNPGYVPRGPEYRTHVYTCGNDANWIGGTPTCIEDPLCFEYIIQDMDAKTASSYYCNNGNTDNYCSEGGLSAQYSHLNATGFLTGGWSAAQCSTDQWIQVMFTEIRVVSGIALKGRNIASPLVKGQYVTKFQVYTSQGGCEDATAIKDESGSTKVFEGTSGADVLVTRRLPACVLARCVRIYPVTWEEWISLRFDVLGCHLEE